MNGFEYHARTLTLILPRVAGKERGGGNLHA